MCRRSVPRFQKYKAVACVRILMELIVCQSFASISSDPSQPCSCAGAIGIFSLFCRAVSCNYRMILHLQISIVWDAILESDWARVNFERNLSLEINSLYPSLSVFAQRWKPRSHAPSWEDGLIMKLTITLSFQDSCGAVWRSCAGIYWVCRK